MRDTQGAAPPLRDLDVRRHEAHLSGAHAINRVNGLHSRIKEFIDGFHGVATRRLWNYLAWFKWIWSFRRGRTARQAASLVVKQVGASPYKTTWRNYKRAPLKHWREIAGLTDDDTKKEG